MPYLYDELVRYCGSDAYPFHMPGHKRRLGQLKDPFSFDITEIDGFDNLHHAEGILLEAEKRAARLYGAEETHFLVNGSTAGILSAIGAAVTAGGHLLMMRASHKAAYHAVAAGGLTAHYLAGMSGGAAPHIRLVGGCGNRTRSGSAEPGCTRAAGLSELDDRKAYGNAVKSSDKKVRTCIAYNYNNSVEKGLFGRAEQDRWNFLAYIVSDHPFSEPIRLDCASKHLRSALKEVDKYVKDQAYLNYPTIRRLFKNISDKEKEQLIDYIISRYLPVDKDALLSFYKGYDEMLMAINSNTGAEYDIKEEFNADSDSVYTQMLELIGNSSYAAKPHSVIMADEEKKKQIASVLKQRTVAKDYQIARVLHTDCQRNR